MSKPKLSYFDAPVSRGEECRLALHAAGVDFEDNRLSRDAWLALKPKAPFGSVPIYEIPGKPALGHSTAIMVLIGRENGLHPSDPFEAARHEGIMAHVEDLRAQVGPSMRMSDPEQKKAAREALARDYLPTWAAQANAQIGDGPFFGGATINVADFKLYMAVRWFKGGAVDHVPATIFDDAAKLIRLYEAVDAHASVRSWYAKTKPA